MIRVAIIADSAILRAGLASVIGAEPDVRIVESSGIRDVARLADGGGSPARTDAVESAVDVVILVPSTRQPGAELVASDESDLDTSARGPATMMLLDRVDAAIAQDAYAAGASAVLAIDAAADELRAALRAVAAGLVVLPAGVSAELLGGTHRVVSDADPTGAPSASLTSREREVLALLAQGLANKVIAARLGITEHTVKTHVAAVYQKLDARNRAEVLVAAARRGLVML
ncbi:MAG TPA: response regulator transcription factor [Gemmatimonadaceae bacterium]|nr:response regulator transcription factor [Gemmatimonadaceae bacterium]